MRAIALAIMLLLALPAFVLADADTQPPATRISYTGPTARVNGTTWIGPVTQLVLSASDSQSAIAATTFTVDGGATRTYTGPFTLAGLADGLHTITFGSMDAAGNVETPSKLDVHLDGTAPGVAITEPGPYTTTFDNDWIESHDGTTYAGLGTPLFVPAHVLWEDREESVVYSDAQVHVATSDAIVGVNSVDLYVNGVLKNSGFRPPFVFDFQPGCAGEYVLTVVSTDAVLNAASTTLHVTARSLQPQPFC